jgi:hypothetical protein
LLLAVQKASLTTPAEDDGDGGVSRVPSLLPDDEQLLEEDVE